MSKRVLFVTQYAEPELLGGNNNVYRQARALRHSLGVDVCILTWPLEDGWTGPLAPKPDPTEMLTPREWLHDGMPYYIVGLHRKYLERVPPQSDWEEVVRLGCNLLERLRPSIVHLQHWRGLWWLLESAQRLGIASVYSPHDWGMCCLRTILVKGGGELCDGIVSTNKCQTCVAKGRNWLGKANEAFVASPIGEKIIRKAALLTPVDRWLAAHGAVRIGLRKRLELNRTRSNSVLSNLSSLIVPNAFARDFYQQFGVPPTRIHLLPWYYDRDSQQPNIRAPGTTVSLGFVGRISPEKGVQRIFEALLDDAIETPIHLVIAGAVSGDYALNLFSRYPTHVGRHSVEWMGWLPHRNIGAFYQKVDGVLIPSECIENGPLTLIEAAAFKRAVIITDAPTVRDIVKDGQTGYLVRFGSTHSLRDAIRHASQNPSALRDMGQRMPEVASSITYATAVNRIYETLQDHWE